MVKTLIEWKTAVSPLLVFRGFAGWLVLALEFLLAAEGEGGAAITTTAVNSLQVATIAEIFLTISTMLSDSEF